MMKFYPNALELAQAAAQEWLDMVASPANERRSVALSGGNIAKVFCSEITREVQARRLQLLNVDFFWADERCVPPDNEQSNFKLANDAMFLPLKIPAQNIHRIRGELPVQDAVCEANAEIGEAIPKNEVGLPVLDLVILGMGENGHVASLCPNASDAIVNSRSAYVYVSDSPKPPPQRISLSYAAIAAAKKIWALIPGERKAQALRESLSGPRTPFGRILRLRGDTRIFTDIAL